MAFDDLTQAEVKNGTLTVAHIMRNGIITARFLISKGKYKEADHRLEGMEKDLQTLIEGSRHEP